MIFTTHPINKNLEEVAMASLLDGRWETVRIGNNPDNGALNSQRTAVHACLAYNPNDDTWKVLYYRGGEPPVETYITTRMWHPPSESATQITAQTIPGWGTPPTGELPRLFCGGHAFMHDGRLFAAGGNLGLVAYPFKGLKYAYIFDPKIVDENSKWSYLGYPSPTPIPMQDGRWYPTVTLLSNGWLLVMSGFTVQPTLNRLPEIWNPDTQDWIQRTHPEAQMPFHTLYPAAHVVPRGELQGKVFYPMPIATSGLRQSYVFDPYFDGVPNGQYYWKTIAGESNIIRDDGCSVLLPIKPSPNNDAKVFIFGGKKYDAAFGTQVANNTAELINLGDEKPEWVPAPSLAFARNHANAVILPDGKVFITGGNQIYLREGAVTSAELFDPEANGGLGSMKLLPPTSYTRMYHSTAILLPDATVWVGGGDTLSDQSSDYIEIYKPGYLFDGPGNTVQRPQIIAISTSEIDYDRPFTIQTDVPIDMAILISLGATTHAFDQNQRAVLLTATQIGPINSVYHYEITAPEKPDIAPPGYYMLFVLRPKSASTTGTNRIPSIAKFLKLKLE